LYCVTGCGQLASRQKAEEWITHGCAPNAIKSLKKDLKRSRISVLLFLGLFNNSHPVAYVKVTQRPKDVEEVCCGML
jgi:hypothetical protein